MATATTLIAAAMRKLGVLSGGFDADPDELVDALEALNAMLGSWSAKKVMIPYTISESFSLVAATNLYTMGSGGTASSTRAKIITGAFIRDASDTDHPVEIITEDKYRLIELKDTQSRPYELFYKPVYPIGLLYVYPTPSEVETMHIDSVKRLSSITSLTTTIDLPSEYEEAIVYNLAIRLAPEFEKSVSNAVGGHRS